MKRSFTKVFLPLLTLCLMHSLVIAGPVLVSAPAGGNSSNDLVLHRHDTNLGAVSIHASLYATAGFTLPQINTAIDAVIASYNVAGSSLNLVRGSDDATVCSAGNIDALIAQTSGFHLYLCPQSAIDQIGLNSNVLGFTVSKTTTTGTIASVVTIVKDTLTLSFAQTVALHEVGHGLGLDHSPMSAAVMFPLTLGSNITLHNEDLAALYALYASSPSNPASLFGGQGACITGGVTATDSFGNPQPLNAVIIKGYDNLGSMVATTVSGTGLDLQGQSNLAGNYTLCAPATLIVNAVAELCNVTTDLGTLQVSCGEAQQGDSALAAGSSPSMLPNLSPMPYDISTTGGAQFIYNSTGTLAFSGDFSIGTAIPSTPGQTLSDVNFQVTATLTTFLLNSNGNNMTNLSGGCQAGSSQSNFVDLGYLALLLFPLGMTLRKRQLIPVRIDRKFPWR